MNRTLALLIPAVLLVGMALIIFQQMNGSENLDPVSVSSLSSQTNASTPLPMGAEAGQAGQQTGQQTRQQAGVVSPPAGVNAGPATGSAAGLLQNATTSASNTPAGAPAGANQANTSTTRSELGRLADAQGAQATNQKPPTAAQPEPKPTSSSPAATAGATENKPADNKPAETKPAEATPQVDMPKHNMQSMAFKYQGSELLFVMKASEHFEYKTFLLPSPDRLVIDLAGAWTGLDVPNVPSNRLVKGLRLGKLEKGHRVVLDLKEVPKGYETSRDGSTVTVRIY